MECVCRVRLTDRGNPYAPPRLLPPACVLARQLRDGEAGASYADRAVGNLAQER